MTITNIETREPVRGEVMTRLDLASPKRAYVARSKTKDGKPDWVVVLGSSLRESSRHDTNLEIEASDLREVASMLIAHADALGSVPSTGEGNDALD